MNKGRKQTPEHSRKIVEARRRNNPAWHSETSKARMATTMRTIALERYKAGLKNFGFQKGNKINYKGGRCVTKNGYIEIYSPEHPDVQKRQRKYILEHKLVMEKHLGRYLTAGENVHHLNGVRDDNRIENLELWIKPQPIGMRAQDAVIWAEEILKKYKDI